MPGPTAEETGLLAERLVGVWNSCPVKSHVESPPLKSLTPSAPFPLPSPPSVGPSRVTLTLKPIGSQTPYTLSDCDTRSLILELKTRLSVEHGLDVRGQRWLVRGKGLENWRSLTEYLVSDDGVINADKEILITLMYKAPSTASSTTVVAPSVVPPKAPVPIEETDWKKSLSSKAAFWTEISQILSKHVSDASRAQEALSLFQTALS